MKQIVTLSTMNRNFDEVHITNLNARLSNIERARSKEDGENYFSIHQSLDEEVQ
jgi:hypothetical protein